MTDSGGVQEEGCILNVLCVTLRENTERPDTIDTGANMLAGTNPEKILATAKKMMESSHVWENPFGNGDAALRILEVCREKGTL